MDLSGAFLPVTTPFDPSTGDIDLDASGANLRRWFEHPASGVLISGSTGESVFLDEAERVALIEAARASIPAEALVIAGTGSESTRHTIHLTRQAADAGAGAVLVSPPAYYKGAMSTAALTRHFSAVADASPVPVLIYQVPLRMSTLDLPTELIATLSAHDNIAGIKDSRGKLEIVEELVGATHDDFDVLVGSGALLQPAMQAGATGGIVAVGLLAVKEATEIATAFSEGRHDEAAAIQARIAPVHQQIVGGMGVPGVKAALDHLGYVGGPVRPPLSDAPSERRDEVRGILTAGGLLEMAAV
ncbi:MAG: dihydrodipicolinate synthase family protein [Gemmatimonadota bacterium]